MKVCVIGLGKMGLPLATQIAGAGIEVIGVDIDPQVVDLVNQSTPPYDGEPELAQRLSKVVETGKLRATNLTEDALAMSYAVVVVVPLVIDHENRPDFRAIDGATASVARGLRRGMLVVYETTLPVGTTRNRLAPALKAQSGLGEEDFFLAFSPERVSSGSVFRDLRRYPKLVGGINEESARSATSFYETFLEFDTRDDLERPNGVWNLGSTETAEFVKLAETTYRDVNIALANEFAAHAEELGLEMPTIIAAANSQPFSHIHRPGVSVGGHCIPVYPHLYMATDKEARLPLVARQINRSQPQRLVERLAQLGGSLRDKTVAILGASYRGGVKETAFSGVFDLIEEIGRLGGESVVHDPLYDDDELAALGLKPFHFGEPCQAAIVHTDHDEYRTVAPSQLPGCMAFLDGRSIVNPSPWYEAGVHFAVIGKP